MPTLIDSLIVELNLDSSGFNEGQNRAIERLRGLEQQVARSSGKIEEVGLGVVTFFRGMNAPLRSVHEHFQKLATYAGKPQQKLADLGAQGRRTGTAVEAGGLAGAAGLRAMGVAGLGAFAAVTALDKLMQGTNERAQKLFGTALGAQGAGMPIRAYTAISQALSVKANVPQADTQATLTAIQQMQNRGRLLGRVDPTLLSAYAQIDPTINPLEDTPQQIFEKVARSFAALSPDAAITKGSAVGFSPVLSAGLRRVGANLDAAIAEERLRAATAAQAEAGDKLRTATNNLSIAWENLNRQLDATIDGPLSRFENYLATVTDLVAGSLSPPEQQKKELRPYYSGLSLWNIMRHPLSWWHQGGPEGPGDTRSWWQRNMPGFLGGTTAPPTGNDSVSGAWTTGPNSAAPKAAPNDAFFNWGSIGGGPATARHYTSPEEGVRAVHDLLLRDYAGLTLAHLVKKYAPPDGGANDTALLIQRAVKMMNMRPNEVPNLNDPETMRRLVTVMIANEHGGAYPRDLSQRIIDQALGAPEAAPKSESGGAYGVPGAIMNFGEHGGVGAPGTNLVQVQTPDNKRFTVNAAAAGAFKGFVADLEKTGYRIRSIGGYNMRDKTGGSSLSEHAYGLAIDINPSSNAYGSRSTDMPPDIHALAAKWGLIWGGDWRTNPDPMHFQWGGSKPWLDTGHGLSLIRSAQAATATSAVTNDHSVEINGGITVHAPLREGTAIGQAVSDEIKRNAIVSQSNTGLQ